jgi:hypothetical protein
MLSTESAAQTQAISLKPQPWRWSHPRVLVEHPNEATGLEIASGLRFAGYAVGICPGPHGRRQCPLTGPAGCAPAHDADLIVCSLGYEHETARAVLHELRTRFPEKTLLVETPSNMDAACMSCWTAAISCRRRRAPSKSLPPCGTCQAT